MKGVWERLNELYINKGLMIFPVEKNGKLPILKAWQKECSSNFMQILYWSENAKDCNWGIPATPNNLFILDLDVHDIDKNGVENYKKICEKLGVDNPFNITLSQETPSGGIHLIFKSDDDLKKVANGSNIFTDYPGIDCRTDGYIVAEPSVINDKEYKFLNNLEPKLMPDMLKEFVLNNANKKGKEKTPYIKPKEQVMTGTRDENLFKYINHLYYKTDLDYDEILELAITFNESFEEPYTDREVEYKVKKAFEKNRGHRIIINLGETDNS